jgi:hypothetical protein
VTTSPPSSREGIAALACLVRGRQGLALGLVIASAVLHPTTALFFGILAGVAVLVSRPTWRAPLGVAAGVAGLAALWAVTAGPMANRLGSMDPNWLGVLASKDYLFPAQWPLDAWLLNLVYPVVIVAVWRARVRTGVATSHESGLVAGLMALLVLFLVSVPFTMLDVALAVQMQITRVFWIMDFAAIGAVSWWLTQHRRVAIGAIALSALASAGRGYYILEVAQPERVLVQFDLPDTPWTDALRWLHTQPRDWHVLADPGHAYKYGISVRVGANRDTVLESVKDSALAMYDREVAMRVKERILATHDYDQLSLARIQKLDDQYDLDAVIVEANHLLALPLLYRNAEFAIYDVR